MLNVIFILLQCSGAEPTISRRYVCTMCLGQCLPTPLPPLIPPTLPTPDLAAASLSLGFLEKQSLVIYSPSHVWDGHVTYTERVILPPKKGKGTSGLFQMDTFEMELGGKRERGLRTMSGERKRCCFTRSSPLPR